ncbi:MAG: aminoglycoside phosphotransferase family protein [Calothrix sp. SM1_7_51]|nr:aminoglycoside phosphotransferase family protein [Calothrix sp. SM1_7_51]
MISLLSSQNVIQYLQDVGLLACEDGASADTESPQSSKNLNLLVSLAPDRKLLVKQELSSNDETPQELFKEWLFHQLLESFPVLGNITAISSLVVHYDEQRAIIVRKYLTEYLELAKFYQEKNIFPTEIASAIGSSLASLHRATFNRREYRNFMTAAPSGVIRYQFFNPAQTIGLIEPEIFGNIPTNALKFFLLYQSFDSLESSIAELAAEWNPCCLIHYDLKLENILVHSRYSQLDNCLVRLIDWSTCAWGDPAYDLGNLLGSYIKIWLDSLVVDPTIDFEESLQLAVTPLEEIQPSMLALIRSYLDTFPLLLSYRKNLILRIVQFAGLALFNQIQENIKVSKHFDNSDICKLQVAKNLLTMPQQSVFTIFGISESQIIKPITKLAKTPALDKHDNLLRLYYEKTQLRGC